MLQRASRTLNCGPHFIRAYHLVTDRPLQQVQNPYASLPLIRILHGDDRPVQRLTLAIMWVRPIVSWSMNNAN